MVLYGQLDFGKKPAHKSLSLFNPRFVLVAVKVICEVNIPVGKFPSTYSILTNRMLATIIMSEALRHVGAGSGEHFT